MIFVGDIVSPTEKTCLDFFISLKENLRIFENDVTVGNLEGLVAHDYYRTKNPILSNHPSIIDSLKLMNTVGVSLANNHTLDLPNNFSQTRKLLTENNIQYFGADKYISDAEKPAEFEISGLNYIVLGFSWDVLMQHQKNESGILYVNPLNPKKILRKIESIRETDKSSIIILKLHWNFDLETIPFPMYRTLSQALIEAGANAVIGSHSHCVQGGERFKDGIIIYGLGNFFFPWYIFSMGKSYFPEWTRTELALQWFPKTNKATCHWFNYLNKEDSHQLKHISSEDFDNGILINKYSPYRQMNNAKYIKWYKMNRKKGFLIPIYKDHREFFRNNLIDSYLKSRIKFARFLVHNNILKRK